MKTLNRLRQWVKSRETPMSRVAYSLVKAIRHLELPVIRPLHASLYVLHQLICNFLANFMRIFYWTPLFKSRLAAPAPRLYLYSGMPLLQGALRLQLGADCTVSGKTTFSGRTASSNTPELIVGNNSVIGWQTAIAVGRKVIIGHNVLIAGQTLLAGYPGHPLDPAARAKGLADTEEQVGDIYLEDNVWLATGVFVMAGVRIGQGTVVAAGSVVTHDLPSGVLAGGVPARVIRPLGCNQ